MVGSAHIKIIRNLIQCLNSIQIVMNSAMGILMNHCITYQLHKFL